MLARCTVHLPPDPAGFAPTPGWQGEVDPDHPTVARYMNAGFLVPVITAPMLDELRPPQHRRRPKAPVDS